MTLTNPALPQEIKDGLPEHYSGYFESILSKLHEAMDIIDKAKEIGIDPRTEIETKLAYDLADRVEKLLGLPVAERLRELLRDHSREEAALIIAREFALGKFGFLDSEIALDNAVRLGLAVVTDGITVAPIQGVSSVRLKKNADGTNYVSIFFAGPIRSAGGTEAAFTLVIADHVKRALGLEGYKADEEEVGRFLEELRIYEREVGNFQYRVSDEDVRHALLHLPVEADGIETDPVEVIVHRGLKRISTDRVRGGALRVINDGVVGRSRKILKLLQELSVTGWEWLDELKGGRQQGTDETSLQSSHFEEVISGRPVLASPRRIGGFRLRYGRSINTGLSSIGIHPAVSVLLDYAVVAGTQVKVDIPGKAATIAFVDSIEGPIVRLADGSVVRVRDVRDAEQVKGLVSEILYLGDILVSFGDFLENNIRLPPSGYVDEWWSQELAAKLAQQHGSFEACARVLGIPPSRLKELTRSGSSTFPTFDEAILLSKELNLALHPRYLFYWDLISPSHALLLRSNIKTSGETVEAQNKPEIKEILERLGVPHKVEEDSLLIAGDDARAVNLTLKPGSEVTKGGWKSTCDLLSELSQLLIKPKASAFIGVRVGRPEKAMTRKMKPPVHVLFPVSFKGGSTRDILEVAADEYLEVELINGVCTICNSHCLSKRCSKCGGEAKIVQTCPSCGRVLNNTLCPACKVSGLAYSTVRYPIRDSLKEASRRVSYTPSPPLKGVKGLTNASRIPEPLEKGILRRKHSLFVYKDGTIRFDATNAVVTHFRPKDIDTPMEKLRELGYTKDVNSDPLNSGEQLVELFAQDVILPHEAGEHLLAVSKFVDELLTKVYNKEAYYNANSPKELVGHLIIGLAPHTSVGVVGRVLGFTRVQVCFAHPYWHSAKRRDCDGDGDSVILLMDLLLNFSREFLPEQIGGLMDAPLLLQPIVLPEEVQRQAHNFDTVNSYPLDFYEATWRSELPQALESRVETVRTRLKNGRKFSEFGFTHSTGLITLGRVKSAYSILESMPEKIEKQIELAKKIRAVNPNEVVSSVLKTHLIPDLVGNMKAYTSQSFRCKGCNTHHRRIPLTGRCLSCGGDLQMTVTRGTVEKYLQITDNLARKFDVGEYLRRRVEIIVEEFRSLFPATKEDKQIQLTDFMP